MPEVGNDIIKATKKALAVLEEKKEQMGKAAYDVFLNTIEEVFTIQAGKIVGDKNFIKELNKLATKVLNLLQTDPKFNGPVSNFVKRLQPISEAITEFQKNTNGIKVPELNTAKAIVIDETIDKMLNNGLNQHFVQPLRDLIYQNVTGGLSLSDARTQIKEYIAGGKDVSGKLGRYLEQTAIQAVDTYTGVVNTKIMEQFDMNGLLMTGSLIDNSSPQCRYVIEKLGGQIKRSDWPKVKKIAEDNGLIPETSFDNLPLHKLHYGCRHNFFPIQIKKTA